MNLRSCDTGLPWTLLSHMISFISPMASVVLASSKKTTVSKFCDLFRLALSSARLRNCTISSSVVPPCTWVQKSQWDCFNKRFYLQNQHVPVSTALRGKVAHEPNESGLATTSLSHYHNWNAAPTKRQSSIMSVQICTCHYMYLNLI